ncbi:hypothetical protein PQQ53_21350 [Paraburkholderia strydomiana]|uniref:hypothetical protein n=1 Tax=Paraburkholderia strydomiana TaxID=1245417 RepID=UPI0038BC0C7B
MTPGQIVNLLSAANGAVGTIVLFVGSYAIQPLEGAVFNSPQVEKYNARIKCKNNARIVTQRVGLALLCLSFLFQAVAVFLPSGE